MFVERKDRLKLSAFCHWLDHHEKALSSARNGIEYEPQSAEVRIGTEAALTCLRPTQT
jgi:hypothetical protein